MISRFKSHKYHAKPTVVDGIRFDSKSEARRFQELKLMERAGVIKSLELQPEYVLIDSQTVTDNGGRKHVLRGVKYRGDFRYIESGRVVVEDVKGVRTRAYQIKRKLFAQKYPGIIFKEVQL